MLQFDDERLAHFLQHSDHEAMHVASFDVHKLVHVLLAENLEDGEIFQAGADRLLELHGGVNVVQQNCLNSRVLKKKVYREVLLESLLDLFYNCLLCHKNNEFN